MAEKCATAIGANSLLSKVGAYFHDIGKMVRPEYFAENQIDMMNKHDMLSPKKSAEAIKTHVTEGIRLAQEYNIPQRIIDFIPMHHGTTLIKHFYAKALEEAEEEETVNEADFRYPGPKPNSKETAIVMICDSAEAISRLTGRTKEEMEKIIDSTIQSRFLDGQFDECNITLKDLQIIKDTCVKHLQGSGHQRVAYKEIPKKNETDEKQQFKD
jgi:putative nucleotidyltransferase with HDIG domain